MTSNLLRPETRSYLSLRLHLRRRLRDHHGRRGCAPPPTYIGLVEVRVVSSVGGECCAMPDGARGRRRPVLADSRRPDRVGHRRGEVATSDKRPATASSSARRTRSRSTATATVDRQTDGHRLAEEGYTPPLPKKLDLPAAKVGDPPDDASQHETHPWISSHDEKIAVHLGRIRNRRRHHHQRPGAPDYDSRPRAGGSSLVGRAQDPGPDQLHVGGQKPLRTEKQHTMREAVIVSVARTAIGRAGRGSLRDYPPRVPRLRDDQGAGASPPGLDPAIVSDVVLGRAMPEGESGHDRRTAIALAAGSRSRSRPSPSIDSAPRITDVAFASDTSARESATSSSPAASSPCPSSPWAATNPSPTPG